MFTTHVLGKGWNPHAHNTDEVYHTNLDKHFGENLTRSVIIDGNWQHLTIHCQFPAISHGLQDLAVMQTECMIMRHWILGRDNNIGEGDLAITCVPSVLNYNCPTIDWLNWPPLDNM